MILVRSTIHMKGLRLGQEVLVDPSIPYISSCLKAGYLVPVNAEATRAVDVTANSSDAWTLVEATQVNHEPNAVDDE